MGDLNLTDYNKIVKRASQMKTNVEKNYKLGIPAQWAYIFAKSILSPKKSVKSKKNIGKAPKPTGNKINIKIYKKDYIQLCKNLVGFVDKKGRLPNYVLFDGKKIRARLYAYCFAKIVVYYHKNKSLPAYSQISSIELVTKEFEKTPKRSIKRFMYK